MFEDFEDVDLDEVTPLSLAVLQMCIDAYTVGLPDGRGALSRRGPSEYTVDGSFYGMARAMRALRHVRMCLAPAQPRR